MFIDNIFELDDIFKYEETISKKTGISVTNISHWNASKKYQRFMLKKIELPNNKELFNYQYTYTISKYIRKQILKKMEVTDVENNMCLLTPSSTISIVNIINFLKLVNYHKICILEPAYFSVEQNCKVFGLSYEKKTLFYRDGKYIIPKKYILENHFDVVWLTSPVYSTGISYDISQIDIIYELIDAHILIIADESLALPGQELSKIIPINKYFYSIYSPHKPLFINSIKFSAIVCPIENDDILEQWIDVLGGGLLQSNLVAIYHYLSPNFKYCFENSMQWFKQGLDTIKSIIGLYPSTYCDVKEIGAYKTIYLNSYNKNLNDIQNVRNIIQNEYISYIPGIYNGFNNDFCFRINLSLDPNQIENALNRILNYYYA